MVLLVRTANFRRLILVRLGTADNRKLMMMLRRAGSTVGNYCATSKNRQRGQQ